MTISEAHQLLDILRNLKSATQPEIVRIVRETDRPLEERWELFKEAIALGMGRHEVYIQHPPGKWDDALGPLDGRGEYFDKYQTVHVEKLEELSYDTYGAFRWATKEDWAELKEWCLREFIKSWEVDW